MITIGIYDYDRTTEIHFVASKPTSPSKPIQGLPHLLKMFWRGEQVPQLVIFNNFTVRQEQIQILEKYPI